jgi:3-oxoacyl-[acyl-carrier protein] reductase
MLTVSKVVKLVFIKEVLLYSTTMGLTGKPEDVANAIPFFASDDSEYMIGTYAPVDRGLVIEG